jgi:CubicO group peptidase (beta-lactamase class C family)
MKAIDPLYQFEPGTGWAYVNTGYVLLGLIVQKVSGESLGGYLKRRLFKPAGMEDTALDDMTPSCRTGYRAIPPVRGRAPSLTTPPTSR